MITITHNGTDITDKVSVNGFGIEDERNSTRNRLTFQVERQGAGFAPELNAEIIVTQDGTRIFGGSVISFETRVEAPPTVIYSVECLDFTHVADRKLITERYENQTVNAIISDLVTDYASDFTVANVDAPIEISKISFNRLKLSECLDKLSKLTGYLWYIDYHKDIHFFAKNQELAPFNITDTSDNYFINSLRIRSDVSQLKNVIEVIGGDVPIDARTTKHAGDGETTEFETHFKFDTLPTVEVNGVGQDVGVEYLNTEGFDCYWSRAEKYVRFDTAPGAPATGFTNIEITGNPLVPLIASVPDEDSIVEFGEFEYSLKENTLKTQDEVIDRALVELEAFANELTEASFDTAVAGLKSGQVLTIDSTLHNTDASYIIQRVSFRPYPNGSSLDGTWTSELASTATMTLVEALRTLLKKEELEADQLEVLLAFYRFTDNTTVSDSVDTPETTERPYYLADGAGVVGAGKEPFICNFAVLEA